MPQFMKCYQDRQRQSLDSLVHAFPYLIAEFDKEEIRCGRDLCIEEKLRFAALDRLTS